MGKDDSRALLYIGIGALAAVGAGILVWKYALTDDTKARIKGAARDRARNAGEKVSETAHRVGGAMKDGASHLAQAAGERAHQAADAAKIGAANAAYVAGDAMKERAAAALEKAGRPRVDRIQ